MEPDESDSLFRALGALPKSPIPGDLERAVRVSAQAEFDRAGNDVWRGAGAWARLAMPTVLATAAIVYLTWAASFASALYQ
jgi:hypothetical protein